MLLFNWLASVRNRLILSRYVRSSRQKIRPRNRRSDFSTVPAQILILEQRCVLSAVMAMNDEFITSPGTTSQPVQLDVLANDSSSAEGLHLVSFEAAQHGTISIDQTDPADPPCLVYTSDVGYVGTETFDYTVADAEGDQATATVTLLVGLGSSGPQSNIAQAVSSTGNTVNYYLSLLNSSLMGGMSGSTQIPGGSSSGGGTMDPYGPGSSGAGSYSGSSWGDPSSYAGSGSGFGSTDPGLMSSSGLPSSGSGSPGGGSTSPSGSGYGGGSSSGGEAPPDPNASQTQSPSGFELENGSLIDAHTVFVLANASNYSSSTTVTEPIDETETGADNVAYVTTGSSTTTVTITATENAGAWTYSEIYTYDLNVTINGSDGSVVTDVGWLDYTFVAAGDATFSGFSLVVDSGDALGGSYTEAWAVTAADGSKSGASIDWFWNQNSLDHVEIANNFDLTNSAATATTKLNLDSSGSYMGTGTYWYDTEGGKVDGVINAVGGNQDKTNSTGTETRALNGAWSWTSGTASHKGSSTTDVKYAGSGNYAITDNGVSLYGNQTESGHDFNESADEEFGNVGTDGKWKWDTGTATFNGLTESKLSTSGMGTYTDTTKNGTADGTLSEISGYHSSGAYSGGATLGADEKWTWNSGGAKMSMESSSTFQHSGTGTYWYETDIAKVAGTTSETGGESTSEEVAETASLKSDGTWDWVWGEAKAQGKTWSDTQYSGGASYTYQVGDPTQTGGITGTVNGNIEESGSATDKVSFAAQQSLGQDDKWAWDWGKATNTAVVDTHYASSGSGTYSYPLPDNAGTVSGDILEDSHADTHVDVSQNAELDAVGNWGLTQGTLNASGSLGGSYSYSGGGAYDRTYPDGWMKGVQAEAGGVTSGFEYDTSAAINAKQEWEWTSGTSHVTSGASSFYSFSGAGAFSTPTFSGKTEESGSQFASNDELYDQSLSSDGKWSATVGTKTQTTNDRFSSGYSGSGGITNSDPNGSITITFKADGNQSALDSFTQSETVGTNGLWQAAGGTKTHYTSDDSNSSYSGKGSYSPGGTGGTSLSLDIDLNGSDSQSDSINESTDRNSQGEWHLVSGSKGTSNSNGSHVAYSGTGSFPMGAGGTGSFTFDGFSDQNDSFSEGHIVSAPDTWDLSTGGKSNSNAEGSNFLLSGTDTSTGGAISVTTNITAYDNSSSYESTSAGVTSGVGGAGGVWGDTTGAKGQTDANGFSMTAAGSGTQSLSIMGGTLNAGVLLDMKSHQDSSHSESYTTAGGGVWDVVSGTRTESSGDSSKLQMNGAGTYSRATTGGTVNGTTTLLNFTTESSHGESTAESLSPAGTWSYISGNRGSTKHDDFLFAYAGSGSYSVPVQGGKVDGGISESGSVLNTDDMSESYTIDAAGDWHFFDGGKLHMSDETSTSSSSGTGTYSYAVTGGNVSGTIDESSFSSVSHTEMVASNRGSIGGWISIGTKTIGDGGGSSQSYSGKGGYSINIPDPSNASSSAGSVSGAIEEDGSASSTNSDNQSWTVNANGDWVAVSGSRTSATGGSSNSKSSGAGGYSYTSLTDANGVYRSISHNVTIEEETENHSGSTHSTGESLLSNGQWAMTSGATSNFAKSHAKANSSGTGDYTFNDGGTSTNPDYKYLSGDLTESSFSLNDSSFSVDSAFTSGGIWVVTSGTKSSTTSSSEDSSLSGSGSYSRTVTDGSLKGSVSGTTETHHIGHTQNSDYTDTWAADATGAWFLQSGNQTGASRSQYNQQWSGSGTYTRHQNEDGVETNASGTITESTTEEHDDHYSNYELKVNASGQWEQTAGFKYDKSGYSFGSTTIGNGGYSSVLSGGLEGTITGTFNENSNTSGEVKDEAQWTFTKAAFTSGWVQDSGLKKNVSKSGGSFTYEGSGSYDHGLITGGAYIRDYNTRSGSTNESKTETFNAKTGAWSLIWDGGSSSDVTNDYAYSGTGTTSNNPPIVTSAFKTEEYHSSSTQKEDVNYKSHTKVTNTWTSDWSGNRETTNDTENSLLNHRQTSSSSQASSLVTTWSNVPSSGSGAVGKQTRTIETDSSGTNSSTIHIESSGSSNVVTYANGAMSGTGSDHGTGHVDYVHTEGFYSRDANDGPMDKRITTVTHSSSFQTHDDFDSTTTPVLGTGAISGYSISNHVTGSRSMSGRDLTIEIDNNTGTVTVVNDSSTNTTDPPYDKTVSYGGFYQQGYLGQPNTSANSPAGRGQPSGNAGTGGAGSYIKNALGQIFFGSWSGAKPNLLGSAGSVAFGVSGFDMYKDILDVSHDLAHWEWTWGHAGNLALDTIGLIPVIGAAKNLAKVADAVKGAPDVAKTMCRASEFGCFTEETEVIVGPGTLTLIAARDNEDHSQWLAILAATGVLFAGRIAVRRLKSDEDEEGERIGESQRRLAFGQSDSMGTAGGHSTRDTELAPRWKLRPDGTFSLAMSEPLPSTDPRLTFSVPPLVFAESVGAQPKAAHRISLESTVMPDLSRRTKQSDGRSRVWKWLASTVGLLTLLIAGACLWWALPGARRVEAVASPSQVRQYETKRISRIVPFDWALAGNPLGERDLQFGDVIDPKQWRLLKLVAPKKGGGEADVDMARPLTWLYSQWQAGLVPPDEAALEDEDDEDSIVAVDDARLVAFDPRQLVGRTIYISVPECGIDGHAKVLAVEDCPNLKPRPGPEYQLVTATFKHRGAKVVDVHVAGLSAPIGSTPNHPFWSEDKRQFVRADALQPGEHLRQADGSLTTVTAVTSRPGTHDVYNFEVHLDHVYHVANNGILVHNGNPCPEVMDAMKIRFTQSTVSPFFKDGRTITDTVQSLMKNPSAGRHSDLVIDVFEHKGVLYSLNNRRLLAFQRAGVPINVRRRELTDLILGDDGRTLRSVRDIARRHIGTGLYEGGTSVMVTIGRLQSEAKAGAINAGKIRPFNW